MDKGPHHQGAKMLLFATVASIAGYATTLFFEGQQIVSPALAQTTSAQPQTSTPEPPLPLAVPLPPNRTDKYDPVGGAASIDETNLPILPAACALGLLGFYLLFRRSNDAAASQLGHISDPAGTSSQYSRRLGPTAPVKHLIAVGPLGIALLQPAAPALGPRATPVPSSWSTARIENPSVRSRRDPSVRSANRTTAAPTRRR